MISNLFMVEDTFGFYDDWVPGKKIYNQTVAI